MKHLKTVLLFLLFIFTFNLQSFAQLNKQAVVDLIRRVIPQEAAHFEVQYIPVENNRDVFEIESENGKIILRGNNGVSVASALKYYLYHFCHCSITWNGVNLHMPDPLPAVKKKIHQVSPYKYRYYLNYCTFNYTMAWWNWDQWQKQIDWMALNGINMPLAITGETAIWEKVYEKLGFTREELKHFFSGPAYFAWLWMGNLDGWGGPLPINWINTHEALQKKILTLERSLGMTPVLPAFTGHVPPDFHQRFPNARLRKVNWGAGFADTYLLDPSDSLFDVIGKDFIKEQTKVYGTDHLYSADTFNENMPPSNDSAFLDGISKKVYESMAAADPEAVWVMQGWLFVHNAGFWQSTQIKALLNAVPDDRMIILDLWSESHPAWDRTDAYYGKPWIWNMLHNFGGNISLFGRMHQAAHDPASALHNPDAGKMVGIGLTPEGIDQNPALYQLMTDNVWRNDTIDLNKWLEEYAWRRYGKKNLTINEAWQILKNTVYSEGLTEGGPESIITGRPTFLKNTDWTNTTLTYNPMELIKAWDLFIKASDSLKSSGGFQYDIVDVTRQVLANYATPLQQKFAEAYHAGDKATFDKYSKQFLQLIEDMNTLLATRKDFLLGPWLADARSWGKTKAEKDLYEFNARDLITLWGSKNSPLHEYACKQWSGLLDGFYKPRWILFFHYVDSCMQNHEPVNMSVFDNEVKDWEWHWVHQHQPYPVKPSGDPIKVSKELYKKYRRIIAEAYQKK